MPRARIMVSDEEIDEAIRRSANYVYNGPAIRSVKYLSSLDLIRVIYRDNRVLDIPRGYLMGLRGASPTDLKNVEIDADGRGISWPALDADFSAAGLLERHYGNPSWMRMLAQEEREHKGLRQIHSSTHVTA